MAVITKLSLYCFNDSREKVPERICSVLHYKLISHGFCLRNFSAVRARGDLTLLSLQDRAYLTHTHTHTHTHANPFQQTKTSY